MPMVKWENLKMLMLMKILTIKIIKKRKRLTKKVKNKEIYSKDIEKKCKNIKTNYLLSKLDIPEMKKVKP